MTALLFNDRGYDVCTSAWTAAAKPGYAVEIAYVWGADGISWFDSATGVSRVTLNIDISEFTKRLASKSHGGILDLRL